MQNPTIYQAKILELYDQHSAAVNGYLLAHGIPVVVAEDLLIKVFATAYQLLPSAPPLRLLWFIDIARRHMVIAFPDIKFLRLPDNS